MDLLERHQQTDAPVMPHDPGLNLRMIEGTTIYLRPLGEADIPLWASWFNDPDVTMHMNKGAFPNSELAQREFLAQLSRSTSDLQLGIVVKENDRLIGTIGLHEIDWIHRHASISVVIGEKAYWGQNLGTQAVGIIVKHAFRKLNLHRLTAGMWSSNLHCRSCFGKNGFQLEGTLRDSYFFDGRPFYHPQTALCPVQSYMRFRG